MNTELTEIFSSAGLRLTSQRLLIFNALKASSEPLSIVQIIRACQSIDKVSVYRAVRLFTQLGIVSTVTHGWKQSYELSAPFAPHHHHMVCSSCGRIIEIKSEKIERLIHQVAKDYAFSPASHHFEVTGICSACTTD